MRLVFELIEILNRRLRPEYCTIAEMISAKSICLQLESLTLISQAT